MKLLLARWRGGGRFLQRYRMYGRGVDDSRHSPPDRQSPRALLPVNKLIAKVLQAVFSSFLCWTYFVLHIPV